MNHGIRAWWIKWRSVLGVLCDCRMPIKLKGKFYKTSYTLCWVVRKQDVSKLRVAEMRL